ncbi:hypothetical protein L505_3675 [Bordetella bronchiseptica F4563]|uniref:hypothetical protein n=1 Tax=Bordetella bronchiseptica TaxID=518 RepID=UPI0004612E7C|nr:hypothetical protein [Bordetella bronchiseptica]KDC23884.1 hypothetical protein L505_3675 [Bordetella bronchiseptica F4563]KDD40918.1 hypothetical protein L532_4321 [Bordetella bronchiseptica OSU095]
MGDMGDYWRDVTPARQERSKQKRASNREHSARLLSEAGIQFQSRNDGAHLIVTGVGGHTFDFWPGTGLWLMRGSSKDRRGVRSLIRAAKSSTGEQQ